MQLHGGYVVMALQTPVKPRQCSAASRMLGKRQTAAARYLVHAKQTHRCCGVITDRVHLKMALKCDLNLFANDLIIALNICHDLYPRFTSFTPARQAALISMAFNLGKPRLAGFRRMRAAINRGNWQGAADEAENSLWARQTRHRATDIAARLRGLNKN